ncbi:protein-disulfide reductase DsbD [Candidatus Ichthyocystis sparus]|uniref:protein-disulfide reductase DsbD n=1 Tax=Candidatus Ichthyocystis sparus TaxID=1561004 RepID=UPI000B1D23E5|nr:protein-disulfide reductase DsbD [Candidatus Ichthyocystis sparus]
MRKIWLILLISFAFLTLECSTVSAEGLENLTFGDNSSKILSPGKAFKVQIYKSGDTIRVHIEPGSGVYVYKNSISISVRPSRAATIGSLYLPATYSHIKTSSNGSEEVYEEPVVITAKLLKSSKQAFTIFVNLKGCSSAGICYPPQTYTMHVNSKTDMHVNNKSLLANNATKFCESDSPSDKDGDSGKFFHGLEANNWLYTLLLMFGLGIMLTFTPCVFPMLPIISSILVGQTKLSRSRSFFLSLAYTLGMCTTYTVAGIVSALSGTLLAAWLQSPVVLSIFALIMVALSLSLFGVFEIGIHSKLSTKISSISNRLEGSTYSGAFGIGALSGLVIGPCIAPPLAGTLLYIAKTGNMWIGGTALFMLALGMGVPLIIIGISADKILPKAGVWMDKIKQICGFSLLGLAVYIVSPVIPPVWATIGYTLVVLACSVWIGFFDAGTPAPLRFVGLLCLLFGIGTGSQLLTSDFAATKSETSIAPYFTPIKSVEQLHQVIKHHRKSPTFIKITAKWCSLCREMERTTFRNPEVIKKLDKFDKFIIDVSDNNAEDRAMMKEYGVFGPPAMIIYNKKYGDSYEKLIGLHNSSSLLKSLSSSK